MRTKKLRWAAVGILGLVYSLQIAAQGGEPATVIDDEAGAVASQCDINVDSWNGQSSDYTYNALFQESVNTIAVRVNPATCTWRFDNTGKPSWITQDVVQGTYVGNGYYRGPAVVDIKIARNAGYARSGRFRLATSSYSVAVDVGQQNFTGLCQFNPVGTSGTSHTTLAQGFIAIAKSMTAPVNTFSATVSDNSSCALSPRSIAFTFGMNGTTITRLPTPARTYQINRAGVQQNLTGEAALFSMNQPGYATQNGVLALELPVLGNLPPEQQITSQSVQKKFLAFGDGGGKIKITSSVRRPAVAGRTCAMLPQFYKVVGGTWLSVSAESGCGSNPDSGNLVIAALPNSGSSTRVGAIFTPWGTVIYVAQAK